jgi:hypothetical protein
MSGDPVKLTILEPRVLKRKPPGGNDCRIEGERGASKDLLKSET